MSAADMSLPLTAEEIAHLRRSVSVLPPVWAGAVLRLCDAAEALAERDAEIARLRAELADAWIPVGERLPALDEPVFAVTNGALSVMVRMDNGEEGWCWVQQHWAWNLAELDGLELDDDTPPRRTDRPKGITTAADLATLDEVQIERGYRDGLRNFADFAERDPGYWHGFLNGMVDGGHCQPSAEQRALARAMAPGGKLIAP